MTHAAEWGQRFQELAADASRLYGRTLRRYNQLLDKVARGELQPDEVQRQFREYLQEQAASSTRDLVELSVGLLTSLLHIESKYRDGLLDGLLPPEGPPPPPPAPESINLTNWFQALATYATEQSARTMARHQQLVDRVASGAITPAQVQEQGRRFLEHHAPAFLGDVMNLGLAFVGRLQQSSSALSDGLYDRVLGRETEEAPRPDPPICIDLRGVPGSVASATIVVENTRSTAADVVCHASEFASRGGGRRFRAALEIAPERFTLQPGELRDVDVRLSLDPATFALNTDYVATLLVSGAGDRDLVVQILARAEEEPQAARSKTVDDSPAPETPEPDAGAARVAKGKKRR